MGLSLSGSIVDVGGRLWPCHVDCKKMIIKNTIYTYIKNLKVIKLYMY